MKKIRKRMNVKKYGLKCGIYILFICFFAVLFIYFDMCVRPVVSSSAKYKMQSLINKAVNDAVIKVMEETKYEYKELVEIEKNEIGEIVSINYNSLNINKLRLQLVKATIEQTQKIPVTNVYVAIGSMSGIEFFQNKGPKMKFTITPSSYVEADIESVFQNTGINQINHQVFIVLKVTANALIPNYSTSVYSEDKVCVAETVIIGQVPNMIGNGVVYSDN